MLQFSLDEAIANPPALIAENPTDIEGKRSALSNIKPLKTDLNMIREAEERNGSVLSRWTDRASFQSFMNAIAMLSAKKQQEELQKQQHKKEMIDKFRLFMQQGQQFAKQDQRSYPQEQSKTFNPFTQQQQLVVVPDVSTKATPSPNHPTSAEPKVTNLPAQAIPKVRKVMKGGILVSMPINARHPPEGKTVDQLSRGENGPVANHDKGEGFGNILDDILARTEGPQETSFVTVKRSALSKSANQNAIVKKVTSNKAGKAAITNTPQGISNKTGQTTTAGESKNPTSNQDLTVSKTSDDGSINIDQNLTIAMPGQHCKFEETHTATLKKSSLIPNDNKALDNQLINSLNNQTILKSNVECSGIGPFQNQQSETQMTSSMASNRLTICDIDSDGHDIIKQSSLQNTLATAAVQMLDLNSNTDRKSNGVELNAKQLISTISSSENALAVQTKTNANPGNDDPGNDNPGNDEEKYDKLITDAEIEKKMDCSAKSSQAKLESAGNGSKDYFRIDNKPDPATGRESIANLSGSDPKILNDENVIWNTKTVKTDKPSIDILRLEDDVTSIVTSSCELAVLAKEDIKVQCEIDIKQDPTALTSDTVVATKQSINSKSENDLKPDSMPVIASHSVVTTKQDIKPDPLGPILTSEDQEIDQNVQPMSQMKASGTKSSDGLSTKALLETEICQGDGSLDVSDNSNNKTGCEQEVNLNLSQEECDRIEDGIDAETGSVSGDLVIDIDCESDAIKTSSTPRITRRMRYLSFTTSESSESEEQTVSSFDWIRNLQEEKSKDGIQNEKKARNFTPQENISCQTRKKRKPSHPAEEVAPTILNNQQNLATKCIIEDNDMNAKKEEGFEVKGEAVAKESPKVNERKRKEYDDKSRVKTGVKKKSNREGSRSNTAQPQESYKRRVTRSMSQSDLDLSRDGCNESVPKKRNNRNPQKRRTPVEQPNRRSRRRRTDTSVDDQKRRTPVEQPTRRSRRRRSDTSIDDQKRQRFSLERSQERQRSSEERPGERRRHIAERPRGSNSKCQERRSKTTRGKIESPEYRGKRSHEKSHRSTSRNGSRRESYPEKQEVKVVIEKEVDEAPSLLSMVSGETFDVTVAQQELSDQRKNNKRGGKKKKKKPTEWFLREREKNMLRTESIPVVKERPPCLFYNGGKCSKGETCEFKHVKIKELCRYYVMDGCDNDVYGMCPRMHDEFPCLFFHKRGYCSYNNNCKYSHAALTEETREILEKYIAETTERKQARALLAEQESKDVVPVQERNNPSPFSNLTTVTNPGSSQYSNPNKPPGLSSPPLLTQPLSTPSVAGQRVKRLCSLSSYKPQLLSSLASSVATVENQSEKDARKTEISSRVSKEFLPGMFKER